MTDRHPRSEIPPLDTPLSEVIRGPRVVLRRLDEGDALALHELVLANLDHLMIMPFAANEPMSLGERRALIVGWAADHEHGRGGAMGIWVADALVGMTGLHRRSSRRDEIEIGYWIDEGHVGLGLVAEAVLAQVAEAFAHPQISVVTICADVSNHRSRATAERAGFSWVSTRPTPPEMRSLAGTDIEAVYELRREDASPDRRERFA